MHYGAGMGGMDAHGWRRRRHTPAAGRRDVACVGAAGGRGTVGLHAAVPAGGGLVVVEAGWAVAAEAVAAGFFAVEAVEVALLAALPGLEAAFTSHSLEFVSDVGGWRGWSAGLTSRHCCCCQFRCRCHFLIPRSPLLPLSLSLLVVLQLEPIISMLITPRQ